MSIWSSGLSAIGNTDGIDDKLCDVSLFKFMTREKM